MQAAARTISLAIVLAFALVGAALALGKSTGATTTHWSYHTYANNVKVVEPLVGPWQLGKAISSGHGFISSGSSFGGSFHSHNDPKYSRYPEGDLKAEVVGYHYVIGPHNLYRRLTLTVEVTSAVNGGPHCVPGVKGKLVLNDSKATISNGETADYVLTQHWAHHACPSFEQGWTNEDGGARTFPHYGGPPHGGQYAVVKISG